MGEASGGNPGPSGLNDLKSLMEKTKEKYHLMHPNDNRWPCPFCLHKEQSIIKCRIHINNEHKLLINLDKKEFFCDLDKNSSVSSNLNTTNTSPEKTAPDLKEFLSIIDEEIKNSNEKETENLLNPSQVIICSVCGFKAKNNRGLKIHSNSCRKKASTKNSQQGNHESTRSELSSEDLIDKLISYRSRRRVMKRIPKGARKSVCEELTNNILDCSINGTHMSWEKLLSFSYEVLCLPPKKEKRNCSLATIIRRNINNRGHNDRSMEYGYHIGNNPLKNNLIRSATEKLSDGDIKGCVRLLCSDEVIAPHNQATLQSLISKHPKRKVEIEIDKEQLQSAEHNPASRAEVIEAIRSFDNGSAGGIDGLRPQHLKDLITETNGELANKLIDALGILDDVMLSGKIPETICPVLYGATLTALMKKSGGIRPIAVGNTFRRMAAKIACSRVRDELSKQFCPKQIGFGVPNGAEAVVHLIRDFILADDPDSILVKLDYSNAFNSIFRSKMLSIVRSKYPSLYSFVAQCYVTKTYLCYGSDIVLSEEGVQQGDPLGPLLFCLVIQPIIESVNSPLNQWYLDDGSVGGPIKSVIEDIKKIIQLSKEVGLSLNPSKCEVLRIKPLSDAEIEELNKEIPGILVPSPNDFTLLGAPLTLDGIPTAILQKIHSIKILISRLSNIAAHQALFILRSCLCIPRMMYLLRTTPCWLFKEHLTTFDLMVKESTENITNVDMDNSAWAQCTLPIKKGGLGLIASSDIASSAFISSMLATTNLRSQMFTFKENELLATAINTWKIESSSEPPIINNFLQKSWVIPIMEKKFETLFVSSENDAGHKARLLASSQEESGAWLRALPSTSLGLCLDNDSLRISVALRIGAKICHPHKCICGKEVDSFGYHGLLCKKALGLHPRHHSLNQTFRKALVSAGVPAILEPPGLTREDGKRPDGLTLTPWSHGKSLLWDATCVHTLANSYISKTSIKAGSAAELAEGKKCYHYRSLMDRYIFAPLGFESLGSWGPSTKKFISEVGKKIIELTKEKRSTEYLKQRLSIDIQRGNAASILGTVPSSRPLDEIFYLMK